MVAENLLVNCFQNILFWKHECNRSEVTLKSEINVE